MAQIVGATAASVLQAGARMAARVSATEVEPLYDSEGGVIVGAAEARPAAPPVFSIGYNRKPRGPRTLFRLAVLFGSPVTLIKCHVIKARAAGFFARR